MLLGQTAALRLVAHVAAFETRRVQGREVPAAILQMLEIGPADSDWANGANTLAPLQPG